MKWRVDQRNMALKPKTAYFKLFPLPLLQLPLFFSTHKKYNNQTGIRHAVCIPLVHTDDVLFFHSNLCHSL